MHHLFDGGKPTVTLLASVPARRLAVIFCGRREIDDKAEAWEKARALLKESPERAAAEVPVVYEGLYARADALIPDDQGYILRETKASTFPLKKDKITPDKPKEHHLQDTAVQAWVMQNAGIGLERCELNFLDGQWQYPGNGDYSGLFRQLDITENVKELSDAVPQWLEEARAVINGKMPDVVTGRQCNEPYACPFHEFCSSLDPEGPEHPIELLPDAAGKGLARKLHEERGYVSILEPRPEELTGKQSQLYRRIQQAHKTGGAILDATAADEINALPYPRYFFDFEGIDLPVPQWTGVRPYEQIPFQWSCHIEREPGIFEHAEFLDLSGRDPSLACIKRMGEIIDPEDRGPILVYHQTYERGCIKGLHTRHPEYTELMEIYTGRLVDLLPIVKSNFYHPDMAGSFSIKKVLPVVAPDLDYEELDEVQEGTAAQVAYIEAALDPNITPDRKREIEERLRTYCRQDTWAMAEIAYFLAKKGRPKRPPGM